MSARLLSLFIAPSAEVKLPVLDRLRGCRSSQFGHQDSDDVEEENEVNLRENPTQSLD